MRRLSYLLAALLMVGALSAVAETRPVASKHLARHYGMPRGGVSIPGFENGVIQDETLPYIYNLEKFLAIPAYPRFYFSEAGADTNPCTEQYPCLTVDKMEEIANRGQVHIILNSTDDWDALTDWTAAAGDESIVITDPPACLGIGPDQPCVIFSSSSFSPQDRAELLCTNAPHTTTSDGLFVIDFDADDYGWFGIQNIQINNCPINLTYKQSNFVLLSDNAKMVALNFANLTGSRGSDVATTGENAIVKGVGANTEAVFLNVEAFIENSGTGYSADFFEAGDGSVILIGTSELENRDTDGTGMNFIAADNATGTTPELVAIGHTFTATTGTSTTVGLNPVYGISAGISTFVADATFVGFTGANNAPVYSQFTLSGTDEAWLSPVTIFRSTLTGTGMSMALRTLTNGAAIAPLTMRCILAEGFQAGDYYWRSQFSTGRTTLAGMAVDFEGLYDDDPAGDHYSINLQTYATRALAQATSFADPSTQLSIFEGDSVDAGGVGVDGTPFGTLASQYACQSADCYALCTADKTVSYTFLNDGIPEFVLGDHASGIRLGGEIANYGAR